jgi:hypothetical protein
LLALMATLLASCCCTASNSQLSCVQCPIIIPRMLDELLVVGKKKKTIPLNIHPIVGIN